MRSRAVGSAPPVEVVVPLQIGHFTGSIQRIKSVLNHLAMDKTTASSRPNEGQGGEARRSLIWLSKEVRSARAWDSTERPGYSTISAAILSAFPADRTLAHLDREGQTMSSEPAQHRFEPWVLICIHRLSLQDETKQCGLMLCVETIPCLQYCRSLLFADASSRARD